MCENGDGCFVLMCAFIRVFVHTDASSAAQRKNKTQQWSNAACGKGQSKNARIQRQITIWFKTMVYIFVLYLSAELTSIDIIMLKVAL